MGVFVSQKKKKKKKEVIIYSLYFCTPRWLLWASWLYIAMEGRINELSKNNEEKRKAWKLYVFRPLKTQ